MRESGRHPSPNRLGKAPHCPAQTGENVRHLLEFMEVRGSRSVRRGTAPRRCLRFSKHASLTTCRKLRCCVLNLAELTHVTWAPTKPRRRFVRLRDARLHFLASIPGLRRQGGTADPPAAGSTQCHDAGPTDGSPARQQPSGGGRRDYRARLNRADGCERRHVRRRPTPPL